MKLNICTSKTLILPPWDDFQKKVELRPKIECNVLLDFYMCVKVFAVYLSRYETVLILLEDSSYTISGALID